MNITRIMLLALLSQTLTGCLISSKQPDPAEDFGIPTTGPVAMLSDRAFLNMPPERQYQVANKLASTLYTGVEAANFFDLSRGMVDLTVQESALTTLRNIRQALDQPVGDYPGYVAAINDKYFRNGDGSPRWEPEEVPLTYLHELPLSREYFDFWMAYQLSNNILFSPAWELDSVDRTDVQSVYNRLVYWIGQDRSVSEIVYEHIVSEENWRRFRSPEDNTREMMEIYLLRFNDGEVPPAAKACQNWHLSDADLDFQLLVDTNYNSEPQTLLDTNNIVSCEDFMRAVAYHPHITAGVTSRIVDQLFVGFSPDRKAQIVNAVVATGPTSFRQIFMTLIVSEAYLLDVQRIRTFEETYFNVADRLQWKARSSFFPDLTRQDTNNNSASLRRMNQNALSYKLGRSPVVATDTLSFAYYSTRLRDTLLKDPRDPENAGDYGWNIDFYRNPALADYSNADFVDYVLLSVLSRRATPDEATQFLQLFDDTGIANNRHAQSFMLFDYVSRLPETYAHHE